MVFVALSIDCEGVDSRELFVCTATVLLAGFGVALLKAVNGIHESSLC